MPFPTRSAFGLLRDKLHSKPKPLLDGSPAPILLLPADVVRYIVFNIPPLEAATLALSSKAILSTVGRQVLKIESTEDRVEFLKHLEIFFPKHLLCYQCGKFHRLPKRLGAAKRNTPCDEKNGRFVSYSPYGVYVPFTIAQGIMNRHRYGENHGIPEKFLRPIFCTPNSRIRGKIVDNELILKRDLYVKHEPLNYCPHVKLADIEHLYEYVSCTKKPRIARCNACDTEIRLNVIILSDGQKRYLVRVCFNLGPCRSPFEDKWQAFTRPPDFSWRAGNTCTGPARYVHLF